MAWETWGLVLAVGALLWIYNRWRHSYWARQGVSSAPSIPFMGHFHKLASDLHLYNDEVYTKYGGSMFSGRYELQSPTLLVGDPELINAIFIKDFEHFRNHRHIFYKKGDKILSNNLVALEDDHWKTLRTIMSPTFSSGKLKRFFPLINDQADKLVQHCMKTTKNDKEFDVSAIFGSFSLDTVASVAFGFETDSINNPNSEFVKASQTIFDFSTYDIIKYLIVSAIPRSINDFFGFHFVSSDAPGYDVLIQISLDSIKARKNGMKGRGDFLDLLLEAQVSNPETVDDICIAAQSLVFLLAGYHTTNVTSCFTAYCLAKHPEYQDKIRNELKEKMAEHGGFNYQAVNDCKLLDACISETQRMWPAVCFHERECTKKYMIPNTSVTIEKGTVISVPAYSLHRDARYWPEPDKWIPERFMPENKDQIVPNTYFPFGGGPRTCIAQRFAKLEVRCVFARLLQDMEIKLVPGKEDLKTKCQLDMLQTDDLKLLITPLSEE